MRYSTFFKFVAFVLCAATLLGMVGSAAGIFFLTELGGKSVHEKYADQLENQALNYALAAGQVYASRDLGGAPGRLSDKYIGVGWESAYFDWTRVGYTIQDPDGKIVSEQPIPDDSYGVEYEFSYPAMGRYMKVLRTAPYEEFYPQATEAVETGPRVTVMPAQGGAAVHTVIVDYTDGHREEWPYDGTQLGALEYNGGDTVTFLSNIGELPMGDGWYPNHILFADSGGNIVYEAYDDEMVVLGSSLDGSTGMIQWLLPAGTVTMEAPVGVTFETGDYSSYDAIPTQGATVASLAVTYSNLQGEVIGSESAGSPDLIGTLFHDYQGNAEFHSNHTLTMDIPADTIITRITFRDAQNNALFEASCPGGVGVLSNDENGYLVFRGQMPGTVTGEIPQETVEATEAPEDTEYLVGYAREKLNIYKAPSAESKVMGSVNAWEEIEIVMQKTFDGIQWALIPGGWILVEQVMLEESADTNAKARTVVEPEEPRNIYATPSIGSKILGTLEPGAEPEIIRQDVFDDISWGLTAEGWILLEQAEDAAAIPATAAEEIPIPEVFGQVSEPAIPGVQALIDPTEPTETEPVAEEMSYPHPEEEIEKGVYYDGQEMIAEYVWETIPDGYTVTVQLAPGALRNELGWTLLRLAEAFRSVLLEALGICIAVFTLCVVHLCCSAGRTRRTLEVRAGGLNRIPLDLYLAGCGFAGMGLVAALIYGSQYLARNDDQLAIIFCGACCYGICLLIVAFFFAFVAQIKTPGGYWWRNSICGRCLKLMVRCWKKLDNLGKTCWKHGKPAAGRFFPWLKDSCKALWLFAKRTVLWLWDTGKRLCIWLGIMIGKCFRWTAAKLSRFFGMLPITWQFLTVGFTLVFFLYVMIRTYKVGYILLGFGIFFAVILYAATAFAVLLESARRMSKGDLDTKVDDRMLIGGFKDFAGRLNDLAGVAVIAAQKQLKSERMKTELITNVSHDIKTPLTSIINYVDLMKKPHSEDQQEKYLEVLDRQSHRLKKLVDDLMEMSKASTGNMVVDIQRMDAGEAVNQALGEFADKLDRVQLVPVFRQPDDPVYMMADGRLVWRVMSNLLSNAVKYALPGTRIYLDLLEMDGKVIISIKNISREELNVNADELMERFVRGDASRNTEGSGLGLNIAQSLMELQRGQLQILVDGDLFKVTMIFPAA